MPPVYWESDLLGFGFAQRRRRLMAQYSAVLGNRVRTGPFAGMQIADGPDAFGLMRLIGTYEPELHCVIEDLLAKQPTKPSSTLAARKVSTR